MEAEAAILAELTRRGAAALPHGRATFLRHLTGTRDILARWQQPADVCVAGLLHSIYSTDVFAHAVADRTERDRIRALAGAGAERLAFLFCSLDRRDLFSAIAAEPDAVRPLRLAPRDGGAPLDLAVADIGDLLAIYLANAADQACAPDGAPAPWLTHGSQLAAWARPRARVVPPVFDASTERVDHDAERALLDAYGAAFSGGGAVPSVLARAIAVGEPLVIAALATFVAGDLDGAALLGARAAARLTAWNTAWDKRLPHHRWLLLARLATDAPTLDPARRAYATARIGAALRDARSPRDLHAALEDAGLVAFDAPLPPRFAAYVATLRAPGRASLQTYPGLPSRAWHDPAAFPIVADLERNAAAIAAECRALGADAFHAESENIARDGTWSVALLSERGRAVDGVVARCPVTAAVLARHRIVRGPAGLAYFSRLAPHTHVAPHAGPTNLRLRVHLGIDVPDGCGIRVGGIADTWRTGRCIVFDDAFVHEAWNDADRERIVLIVDVWHPDLSDDEVALLEGLHRHVAGHAANLHAYWERNDAARAATPAQERPTP